eukprot:scaffold15968_cov70-Skeletonema_dohrnii-CCMP3373.AAC.1
MSEEDDLAVLIYKSSKTAKARAAAAAAEEEEQKNAPSRGQQTSTPKRSFVNQGDEASMDRPRKKRAVGRKQNPSGNNQTLEGKVDWRKYAKMCSAEGCSNLAKKGGVCIRHGAQVKVRRLCSSEGCTNLVVEGGVCVRHGAKVKRCSSEGCTNHAQTGGVCMKHGAKKKLCSSEGCTNQAKRGGVCLRHGASRTPYDGSTAFGSEYEKTTATLSLPHQSTADASNERSAGIPGEVVICEQIVEV